MEVSDDGDQLSEDELPATAYLLILAGYETTVNLIGNGLLALLQHPSQLAALRANPSRPDAVEEFLRFESPVNIATVRFTIVPIRIGEVEIPADEFVMIALLAANHDSDQFDEPDRLNIARNPNAHLAFGHGIHYCVGHHWPGSKDRSRSAGCWPGSSESRWTTRQHCTTATAP